jgi:hypothetical protein
VYLCETVDVQITDVTSPDYSVTWKVTASSGNSTNENLIASMLAESLSISPMTLLHNTQYTLEANVSDNCASQVKEVMIETVKYPIQSITSPTNAAFLSWWENEGTLLGCATCSASSADAVPTCQTCSTPLQKDTQGSCLCQNQNSFIDLTNFPQVSCQSKSNSLISWSLRQKSPNIQMQTNFNNGFAFNEAHLNYTAATIGVTALNDSITIQDYSAISNNPNITLSFTIPQDVVAGVTIGLTNLSEYNKLLHSPFLIQNPGLTYQLPAASYLSPETIETLTTAGSVTTAAMQAQAIASAVIPAITGGMSTSAMLLIGFLAEVDLYKYINVPFPDNFNLFCECIAANLLPNLFADFDDNDGANPNSTIGKFEFWGVSATMLDNSSAAIFKDLVVLGIIVAVNILMFVFNKCPDLYSLLCKVKNLLMWNLFLSFYLGDYSELQLNAMIELREHSVSSLYSNVSLAFSIIIVVTYALLKIYILFILNRKRRMPPRPQQRSSLTQSRERRRWYIQEGAGVNTISEDKLNHALAQNSFYPVPQCVAIISEDFLPKNAFTRNFFLITILENFLLILLVFFFQDYGLVQAIIYTILAIIYVAIIAWQRPYKSKFQLVILLINQISKVAMGIIAIMIGVNEKTNSIPQESITQMGNALILLIVIVIGINLVIALLITAVEVIKGIKRIVNQIRLHLSKKSKHKSLPKRTKAHHRTVNQRRVEGTRLQSRSDISKRSFIASATPSFTRMEPISLRVSGNLEDSSISERITKRNARRELIARAVALRTGNISNRSLSKIDLSHNDSTDSNTSLDQSPTGLIVLKKLKRQETQRSDRIARIRELGQLRRAQIFGSVNKPSDRMESKQKIKIKSYFKNS